MKITRKQNIWVYPLNNFGLETFVCDSQILKGNPLRDPSCRYNPVMLPRRRNENGFPVVFVLSGFLGNGTFAVAKNKNKEENHLQQIDRLVDLKQAPEAVYVFADAMTSLGGSQFLDSPFVGFYESYIVKELVPALKKHYPVNPSSSFWCVTGGSSGGYGALHLVTKYPKVFGYAVALAPDCDFEMCYLSDLLYAAQFIKEVGSFKSAVEKVLDGSLQKHKHYHQICNGIAMAACYSAKNASKVYFPMDLDTGQWRASIKRLWNTKDPIHFVQRRKKNLRFIHGVYLAAGANDEFFLNYGTKKLAKILKKLGVNLKYEEFNGGHFDLHKIRPNAYAWLRKKWH